MKKKRLMAARMLGHRLNMSAANYMGSAFPSQRFRSKPLVIVAAIALVYLVTLTGDYYQDGITFALQIEKVASAERGTYLLFHQNHLLYNLIGYLNYKLVCAAGLSVRSLYILQITNCIAGAAAIGIFFRLAEKVTRSRYAALISAAVFAFAAVWRRLATDANAYVISILLILICSDALMSKHPRLLIAGLTLACAMLIHQLASLFYPAALVAVFANNKSEHKWRFAAKLTAIAWGLTIGAYYLCAVFIQNIKGPLEVFKWAISNPSDVSPSANPMRGLEVLPRGSIDMFVGHSFALFRSQAGVVEKVFALAALLCGLLCLFVLVRSVRSATYRRVSSLRPLNGNAGNSPPTQTGQSTVRLITRLSLIRPLTEHAESVWLPVLAVWAGTYIFFLLFWEPWQVLYRAFYVAPLALALGLLIRLYHDVTMTLPSGAAALMAITLVFSNVAFLIIPHMRTTSNPLVSAAFDAQRIWNAKTIVYFSDRTEADTAFEYFNNQTKWRRLNSEARSSLTNEIHRASSEGEHIWLNKGAFEQVKQTSFGQIDEGRKIWFELPNASVRYVELLPTQ